MNWSNQHQRVTPMQTCICGRCAYNYGGYYRCTSEYRYCNQNLTCMEGSNIYYGATNANHNAPITPREEKEHTIPVNSGVQAVLQKEWMSPDTHVGKSIEARDRENQAKRNFDDVRMLAEQNTTLRPGWNFEIMLLHPNYHLTARCWCDFTNYVRSYLGWRAVRRLATKQEQNLYGETRKCKVYWVYLKYCVPKPSDRIDTGLTSPSSKNVTSETLPSTLSPTQVKAVVVPDVKVVSKKVTSPCVTDIMPDAKFKFYAMNGDIITPSGSRVMASPIRAKGIAPDVKVRSKKVGSICVAKDVSNVKRMDMKGNFTVSRKRIRLSDVTNVVAL